MKILHRVGIVFLITVALSACSSLFPGYTSNNSTPPPPPIYGGAQPVSGSLTASPQPVRTATGQVYSQNTVNISFSGVRPGQLIYLNNTQRGETDADGDASLSNIPTSASGIVIALRKDPSFVSDMASVSLPQSGSTINVTCSGTQPMVCGVTNS